MSNSRKKTEKRSFETRVWIEFSGGKSKREFSAQNAVLWIIQFHHRMDGGFGLDVMFPGYFCFIFFIYQVESFSIKVLLNKYCYTPVFFPDFPTWKENGATLIDTGFFWFVNVFNICVQTKLVQHLQNTYYPLSVSYFFIFSKFLPNRSFKAS